MHQFIGHITSARPREGAPAAFPFICLLSSVTAEFRPSVSVDFCFDVCFVAGSAVISTSSQGSCQWRQRKILVATKFRRMSFGMPLSSTVGRLREDFAEHPLRSAKNQKMLEVRGASQLSGCKCSANSASSVNSFIHVLMSAECYFCRVFPFFFFYSMDFLCHCCCCYCLHGCPCKLQRLKHIVIGKASRKDSVTNLPLR